MNGLVFYGLVDFYENKDDLLRGFKELSLDDIYTYKMYVYSLPFMKDDIKDLIWGYLNEYEGIELDIAKEYRKAKEKIERRKQYEMENPDKVVELE